MAKEAFEIIQQKQLHGWRLEDLPEYAKEWAQYTFWHYTSVEKLEIIRKNKKFRLGSIENMNDRDEAILHQADGDRVHAMCFCNSDTESIPMWYLYAGLDGAGVAIGLTPREMLDFIRSIQTVYTESGKELKVGRDVEIRCGWVAYQKKNDPNHVFYKNNWRTLDDAEKFNDENYFIKVYPWLYEQEFRIVVINHTGTPCEALFANIPEKMIRKLKLRLAPEFCQVDGKIKDANGKTIADFPKNKMEQSKLGIRMNLLERNKKAMKTYVRKYCIESIIDNMLGF